MYTNPYITKDKNRVWPNNLLQKKNEFPNIY